MGGFEHQTLGDTKCLIFIDPFVPRDSDGDDRIATYLPLGLVKAEGGVGDGTRERKRCIIN